MSLIALSMMLAMQDPQTVTAVERLEFTPAQSEGVSLLLQAGRAAGRCVGHLPQDTVEAFDAGVARARQDPPTGPGPAMQDVVFYDSYGRGKAEGGAPSRSRCEADLTDARLLIEGHRDDIASLGALMPTESERPWERIGQAAVAAGAEPRRRVSLAAGVSPQPGAVRTPPQWAATPRVPIPSQARASGVSGWASIECVVTTTGRARDCRLMGESTGGQGFGEAALRAQDDYRFRPSTIDGQPVEARSTFRIQFRP